MHSTVQTGLYTPNIFGYDYNYHNHPPPPNAFTNHHHPPRPFNYNPNKSSSHHNLNYQLAKHPPLSSAPPPSHHHHQQHQHQHQHKSSKQQHLNSKLVGSSSINASLLAIGNDCDDNKSISSAIEPYKQRFAGLLGLTTPKRLFSSSSNLDRMILATDKKKQPKISPLAMTPAIKLEKSDTKSSTSLCSCLKQSDNVNSIAKANSSCRKCSICDSTGPLMKISNSNISNHKPKKSNSLNCLIVDKSNNINLINNKDQVNNNSSDSSSQISYKANFVPVTGAIITTGALAMKKSSSSNNYHIADRSSASYFNDSKASKDIIGHSLKRFKEFWQCTKPCGVLTLVVGVLLVLFSITGNIFSFTPKLCEKFDLCKNQYLSISFVSSGVIGFVFVLIGLVIIIYTKKDENTQVIITSSKNMDKIDYDQVAAVTATPNLQQQSTPPQPLATTATTTICESHQTNKQRRFKNKQHLDESVSITSKARNSMDLHSNKETDNSRDENEYNSTEISSEEAKRLNAKEQQPVVVSPLIKININDKDIDESLIDEKTSCLKNEIV